MTSFSTRTLCECVPVSMPSRASSFGCFGSRTSKTRVPSGALMLPMYAMSSFTTTWPPPAQSMYPTSRMPVPRPMLSPKKTSLCGPGSVHPGPGGLDDRPVPLDLLLDERGELLRRAVQRLSAAYGVSLLDVGHLQDAARLRVQPAGDRTGRERRSE